MCSHLQDSQKLVLVVMFRLKSYTDKMQKVIGKNYAYISLIDAKEKLEFCI